MKLRFGIKIILLVAWSLLPLVSSPAGAQESGRSDVRIYVDPKTGEAIEPPPAEAARQATPASTRPNLSTRNDDLKMRPGTTKGGGMILDLEGRFQDELRVTSDAAGLRESCKQKDQPDPGQ